MKDSIYWLKKNKYEIIPILKGSFVKNIFRLFFLFFFLLYKKTCIIKSNGLKRLQKN